MESLLKTDLPNYFTTQELVPKQIYQLRGEKARELLDPLIIKAMNLLRHISKCPMVVNTPDGKRDSSGLRIPTSQHYRTTSMHTVGKAIDSISTQPPSFFHKIILENPDLFEMIGFIEIDISWLHIDSRINSDGQPLKLWSPKRGFVSIADYKKEIGI